jgi:DNA-binding transcriptional LysR family regulator
LVERVFVSNLNAVLRVVLANLAISVLPVEVAQAHANVHALRIVPLSDEWTSRRFALCFRSEEALTPAARLLVDHLNSFSSADSGPPAPTHPAHS